MGSKTLSQIVLSSYCCVIALLPFARLSELPLLILAVMGIYAAVKHFSKLIMDARFKILNIIYFAYFIAIMASSLDSFWQMKTVTVGIASLRFYFATVALILFLRKEHFQWLVKFTALACLIWSIDAIFQFVTGFNLLGFNSYPGRLNGIFGEHHAKLGPVLALLLPCLLIQLTSSPKWLRWLLVLCVSSVILLTGTRSAWIMLVFSLFAFFIFHVKQNKWLFLLKTSTIGVLLVLCLWLFSDSFKDRIDRTITAFEGSSSSLDFALAHRLPIWQVSIEMIKSHPFNGIGAHAFRKAYPDYASEGDIWQKNGGVGMHAHHWVLEVLAETGIIGMIIICFAIFKLIRFMTINIESRNSWPFIISVLSAFLPVVSTYSIFASFWSICLWLMGSALITVSADND